jgi:polar amino acid transport system ATP-binding protein
MHTGKVWETGGADILGNPQTPELKEFMAAEL